MEIISVNIQKGGCAKTTSVEALGEIFSKIYKKKVLIMDMDSQCSLSIVLGADLNTNNNMLTLLQGDSVLEDCIQTRNGMDIIPGSFNLSSADQIFTKIGKEHILKNVLKSTKNYDIVLFDTAPALNVLNIMALTAANYVLIPTEPSYMALTGLGQLAETMQAVQTYLNPELKILGMCVIKFKKTAMGKAFLDALQETASSLNTKIFKTKIRETVKIQEAQGQKASLLDWDKKNNAVEDYKALAREILKDIKQ